MPKHIAILGAGPGEYAAAIRAAQRGACMIVVESQALGGVCLNWGRTLSRALLSVVELGDSAIWVQKVKGTVIHQARERAG